MPTRPAAADRDVRSTISASGRSTAFGVTLLALRCDVGIRESPSIKPTGHYAIGKRV